MYSWEIDVLLFFQQLRNDVVSSIFDLYMMLGNGELVIVMLVCVYFAVSKEMAHKFCFVTVASLATNSLISSFLLAPFPHQCSQITCARPEAALGYSMPSGKTQTISTWSWFFAIESQRKLFKLISCIMILLMGICMMYFGISSPVDVIVGILVGTGAVWLLGFIYDSFQNKSTVYKGFFLLVAPCIIMFLYSEEMVHKPFFQFVGIVLGMMCGTWFEKKFVNLQEEVSRVKKFLRCIIGIAVVFGLKEGLKFFYYSEILFDVFILDTARHFIMIFSLVAILPLVYKKVGL